MTTTPTPALRLASSRSPQDRRRLREALVVAGSGALFGLLAVMVRLSWSPVLSLDAAVARSMNGIVAPHPALVRALTVVTALGSAGVLVWLVGLTAVLLLTRRRFLLAGYLTLTTAGAIVLDPILKALIGRLRPVVPHPVAFGGGNSFPSGHALDSFICYGALLLVFLPAFPRRRRWIPATGAAVLVGLVGLTRIMLGVHFVSDVVGGWAVGVAWLGLTVFAFELFRSQTGHRVPQPLTEGIQPEAAADVEPTEPAAAPAAWTGGLRTVAWLVVGWVFVLGALVGLGELVKRADPNLLGDESIPHWLAAHRTATLNAVTDFWSQAGNTHAIMAVGLVAGAIAIGLVRRWRPAVFLVVLMMGELTLFLVAARVVGRDRPDVDHLDGPLPTSAYPSGHVAATLCLYAGIVLLVRPRTRAWWTWLLVGVAVAMPLLVAVSRLYRGMHHPTDLVGSLVLASGWIAVCFVAIRPNADTGAAERPNRVTGATAARPAGPAEPPGPTASTDLAGASRSQGGPD
jgi:undecaprenyl-diphosphatase